MRCHLRSVRLAAISLGLLALSAVLTAQQPTPSPEDAVIRVDTSLMQTALTVFDSRGRFVKDLKKDEFELRVQGRIVPIAFFETIQSGSMREREIRITGQAGSVLNSTREPSASRRTIVFFLDDLHLSLDSLARSQRMLADFIDNEMSDDDSVAIASSSGRVGFLQQFTDNKDVLRAAVRRLRHIAIPVTDYAANPGAPMTEYMALSIERRDDSGVFDFYVQNCLSRALRGSDVRQRRAIKEQCEVEVRNRARQILLQASTVTEGTYLAMDSLIRTSRRMAGSKLAFFVSDGFLLDTGPRARVSLDRLTELVSKARDAGMVIYSIDARGTVSGSLDASGNVPMDPDGRLENANLRAVNAVQDPLSSLATDTGGRLLANQNGFGEFVREAVSETSQYYLVAWRPEDAGVEAGKTVKLDLRLTSHPDYVVRFGRKLQISVPRSQEVQDDQLLPGRASKALVDDLGQTLANTVARNSLPVEMESVFIDVPGKGTVLTTSIGLRSDQLSYAPDGNLPAKISIAGVILNDQGKVSGSFTTTLTVDADPKALAAGKFSTVVYNYPTPLKSGIYQVRVAVRDDRSKNIGSAAEWIVIPDLSLGELSLSSLLMGIQSVAGTNTESTGIQWSVDKTFRGGSKVRAMAFVYNTAESKNLSVQTKVLRNGREVSTEIVTKTRLEGDVDKARVPLTLELDLTGLARGKYRFHVVVRDRVTGKSASRESWFFVE